MSSEYEKIKLEWERTHYAVPDWVRDHVSELIARAYAAGAKKQTSVRKPPAAPEGWGELSQVDKRALVNHLDDAVKLWRRQELMRKQLGGRSTKMTCQRLAPIARCLARGATYDECVRVLSVSAREARETKSIKWFNGVTPWRKENFERRLGMYDEYKSGSDGWD